jgi:hypothetical protein
MKKPLIVNMIKDVIDDVRKTYDPINLLAPYYEYGHLTEIINTLSEKTKSAAFKFQKYPAIFLLQDFTEKEENDLVTVDVTMLIVTQTKAEFKAKDRYVETFEKVLYPIYDQLKDAFEKSPHFLQYTFDMDATDRLYWGKNSVTGNTGNLGNDFIDAIEINNLKLTIQKQCK